MAPYHSVRSDGDNQHHYYWKVKQMMYTLRVRSANAVIVIILCVEKSVNKHMLWKSLYIASAVLHCPQYYILWQVYEYS